MDKQFPARPQADYDRGACWTNSEVVFALRAPDKSKRQNRKTVCGAYYLTCLSGLRCEACNCAVPYEMHRFDGVEAHCATPEHQSRMEALYSEVPITNFDRLLALYKANLLPRMPDLAYLSEDPGRCWHINCGLCNTGFKWERMEDHLGGLKHQVAVRRLARNQMAAAKEANAAAKAAAKAAAAAAASTAPPTPTPPTPAAAMPKKMYDLFDLLLADRGPQGIKYQRLWNSPFSLEQAVPAWFTKQQRLIPQSLIFPPL